MLAVPLDALDSLAVHTADALGAVPGATVAGTTPPGWVIAPYYALLMAWSWYGRREPRVGETPESAARETPEDEPEDASEETAPELAEPSPTRSGRCLVAAAIVLTVAVGVWCVGPGASGRLVMTVLDVGSGTAIVLELPHGETVLYDAGKCIGCRYCMVACPFDTIGFQWDTPNPYIQKCTFCADRLAMGAEPACASVRAAVSPS